MRHVVFCAAMAVALIGAEARAADRYTPVAVKIANPVEVPGLLEKLLAGLRTAADKKDLSAVLAQVGNSFFWARDHGGGFRASVSPRENFTTALNLDPKRIKPEYQAELWTAFRALLDTHTASTYPGNPGLICLPGKGKPVNQAAAQKTADRFGTDPGYGMMFAVGLPVAVRKTPGSTASIVGHIKNEAVIVQYKLRTDPDAAWEPVQLADGARGWVRKQQIRTFLDPQLCFARGTSKAWKIVGYYGGGD